MFTIGQKIESLRKEKNMTRDDLAKKIGISSHSIFNYETEKRLIPIDILNNIAIFFDIPIESFFNDSINTSFSKGNTKRIPIYSNASAGKGKPAIEDALEWIELPVSLSKNADFAAFIEGDSMEPKIHNFDLALVHCTSVLENGDVGIFNLNDNILCKKFSHNPIENRVVLKSFNIKYNPIEVLEDDSFRIIGKVVANIQYNI